MAPQLHFSFYDLAQICEQRAVSCKRSNRKGLETCHGRVYPHWSCLLPTSELKAGKGDCTSNPRGTIWRIGYYSYLQRYLQMHHHRADSDRPGKACYADSSTSILTRSTLVSPKVWAWVKCQLRKTGQEWEPEIEMLILVAELQPLLTRLLTYSKAGCYKQVRRTIRGMADETPPEESKQISTSKSGFFIIQAGLAYKLHINDSMRDVKELDSPCRPQQAMSTLL